LAGRSSGETPFGAAAAEDSANRRGSAFREGREQSIKLGSPKLGIALRGKLAHGSSDEAP
jgi:hypothetical protein